MDFFSPPPVMPETAALTKWVGSLEQKILLCVVSAFVSIINPNLSDNCPFLLLEGNRLSLLSRPCQNKIFFFFQLLQAMLKLWKATFSSCTCSSWPTVTAKSGGWNLILFGGTHKWLPIIAEGIRENSLWTWIWIHFLSGWWRPDWKLITTCTAQQQM